MKSWGALVFLLRVAWDQMLAWPTSSDSFHYPLWPVSLLSAFLQTGQPCSYLRIFAHAVHSALNELEHAHCIDSFSMLNFCCYCLWFSCWAVSDSLRLHGLQHVILPYPSLSPEFAQFMPIGSVMPSNDWGNTYRHTHVHPEYHNIIHSYHSSYEYNIIHLHLINLRFIYLTLGVTDLFCMVT